MSEQTGNTYDLIVIGAGPVGENVADRALQGGLSAVIVESELVGGECSYWACMPSKALLRGPAALRAAEAVGVTGSLDPASVLARRDSFTSHWHDDGQVQWLDSTGIDLVRGTGRLTGPREVTVAVGDGTTRVLTARHAVAVCTGTSALVPDIPGLREANPWTSREATSALTIPETLLVVGGGVVAVEMATAFAGLGSRVFLRSRSSLLHGQEPIVEQLVMAGLTELGVSVQTGVSPVRIAHDDTGVTAQFDDGSTLRTDEILVATGRTPRTENLGLGTVGLTDGDWLTTDDTLLVTDVPGGWLYAVGDVNHRALLTHQGKYQARAAGDVIVSRAMGSSVDDSPWGAHAATADHRAVPQVIFSSPEVATVGLTAEAATDAGIRIRVADYDLGGIAGAALQADGYSGHARIVVDEARAVIVGATFVGQDVAELLHSATIAVVGEVPINRLWHAVPSYPTTSEVWLRLLEELGRGTATR